MPLVPALKLTRHLQAAGRALGRKGDWSTSQKHILCVEKGDRLFPAEELERKSADLALPNCLIMRQRMSRRSPAPIGGRGTGLVIAHLALGRSRSCASSFAILRACAMASVRLV